MNGPARNQHCLFIFLVNVRWKPSSTGSISTDMLADIGASEEGYCGWAKVVLEINFVNTWGPLATTKGRGLAATLKASLEMLGKGISERCNK